MELFGANAGGGVAMVHRFDVSKSKSLKTARIVLAAVVAIALLPVLGALLDANVEKAAADRHADEFLTKALKAMGDLSWFGSPLFLVPLSLVAGVAIALWTAQWWLNGFSRHRLTLRFCMTIRTPHSAGSQRADTKTRRKQGIARLTGWA
jgi:hypothetical protein